MPEVNRVLAQMRRFTEVLYILHGTTVCVMCVFVCIYNTKHILHT